jgi:hypothetical protein
MKEFDHWPDPKLVGQAEYSMIYDLILDARAQAEMDNDDPDRITEGILEEFKEWVTELLTLEEIKVEGLEIQREDEYGRRI